ncbi:dihydrofolate reductase family protein [Pseudonocardia sp. H11422]|uniref:dihydrofolate reductase family protein n=1 Tax=Pseudonocardia sp. H11422 TaxID=2835866 RepID=UPI001BDCE1F9|nr:dihydrofolate reductase family protein [Pseudonocardia sp. H11422]
MTARHEPWGTDPPFRAPVFVSGGARVVQTAPRAELLDELNLHVAPVLIDCGTRLFDEIAADHIGLESMGVVAATGITHLRVPRRPLSPVRDGRAPAAARGTVGDLIRRNP